MSPVWQFSDRDMNRNKVVTPAWYRLRIDSIGEAPSSDGKSINFPVEATIIRNADTGDDTFKNVPIDWNFNSKAMGFGVTFLASFGVDVTANKRFDPTAAVGKEIEVFVENDTWQGRVINRVNHKYRPVTELRDAASGEGVV